MNLLKRIGLKPSSYKERIYFSSKIFYDIFSECGHSAKTKHIPFWMKEYDSKTLIHLFNGIMDSDGHKRVQLSTISRYLLNDVIELGYKLRYKVTYKIRKSSGCIINGRELKASSSYFICFSKTNRRLTPENIFEKDYSGKIWCLELSYNHNFLVERNGKFTFSGNSCEGLGHIAEGKASESFSPRLPRSPYAASKLAAEAYVYSYHATYGLGKIARCFNITGPRQKSGGKGAVTSIFIDKVLRGEQLKIYGDGLQTRDFTDARDIARGLAEMLERDLDGELIHLCSGVERSVNDVAEAVLRVCKVKQRLVHVAGRPGELRRSVGDNGKARRVLGWSPLISFTRTIQDMVKHRRSQT